MEILYQPSELCNPNEMQNAPCFEISIYKLRANQSKHLPREYRRIKQIYLNVKIVGASEVKIVACWLLISIPEELETKWNPKF